MINAKTFYGNSYHEAVDNGIIDFQTYVDKEGDKKQYTARVNEHFIKLELGKKPSHCVRMVLTESTN